MLIETINPKDLKKDLNRYNLALLFNRRRAQEIRGQAAERIHRFANQELWVEEKDCELMYAYIKTFSYMGHHRVTKDAFNAFDCLSSIATYTHPILSWQLKAKPYNIASFWARNISRMFGRYDKIIYTPSKTEVAATNTRLSTSLRAEEQSPTAILENNTPEITAQPSFAQETPQPEIFSESSLLPKEEEMATPKTEPTPQNEGSLTPANIEAPALTKEENTPQKDPQATVSKTSTPKLSAKDRRRLARIRRGKELKEQKKKLKERQKEEKERARKKVIADIKAKQSQTIKQRKIVTPTVAIPAKPVTKPQPTRKAPTYQKPVKPQKPGFFKRYKERIINGIIGAAAFISSLVGIATICDGISILNKHKQSEKNSKGRIENIAKIQHKFDSIKRVILPSPSPVYKNYYDSALKIHLGETGRDRLYNHLRNMVITQKLSIPQGENIEHLAHVITVSNLVQPNSATNQFLQGCLQSQDALSGAAQNKLWHIVENAGDRSQNIKGTSTYSNFAKQTPQVQKQHLQALHNLRQASR